MVYDTETSGVDAKTCSLFQIAACIIHPRRLEILDDKFGKFCKPAEFDSLPDEAFEYQAKVRGQSISEFKAFIGSQLPEKEVWADFCSYVGRYHAEGTKRRSKFSAVVRAGHNIVGYDNVIWNRLCTKYGQIDKEGEQNLAHPRDNLDLLHLCFINFENLYEPEKYNLDYLREYFGLSSGAAHDAEFDVKQEANILVRFLKFHRACSAKAGFKGSFLGESL
jgi:DNA polymerase III epsilon subunit-like protein